MSAGNPSPWMRVGARMGARGVERRFTLGLLLFILAAAGLLLATGRTWPGAMPKALERVEARFEKEGRAFPSADERTRLRLKAVPTGDLARTCVWWATLVNGGLACGLLATRRWWLRPISPPPGLPGMPRNRRFLLALLVILLGGLALRLPRMGLSLYNDEAFNFTRYIHGQFKSRPGDPESEPRFKPVTWQETLWDNQQGNNGVLYSLLARGCHDLWSAATGAVDGEFREWPLRLPALLPSLASIFLLGLIGYRLGGQTTGWLTAVVAAAHPWHLRYGTEARPYGLVIFGVSLAFYAFLRARERNQWRWWLTYGLSQWILLAAFAGTLHFALGLNAVAGGWLLWQAWRKRRGKGAPPGADPGRSLACLLVANLLAAMLYLQILLPGAIQIAPAVTLNAGLQGAADGATVRDIATYLAVGMPWIDANPENPLGPALERLFAWPWWTYPLFLALGLLASFALRAARRGDPAIGIVFLASVIALALAVVASRITGVALHRWYATYLIPASVLALGLGGGAMLAAASREVRVAGVLALLLWGATTLYATRSYLQMGKENLSGISHTVRGGRFPFTEEQRRVMLGAFWSDPVYVPDLVYTPEVTDIDRLVEKARREGRPLYIEFGHRALALTHNPDTVARLEESPDFERVGVFSGLDESQFTHYLFRFVPTDNSGATRGAPTP